MFREEIEETLRDGLKRYLVRAPQRGVAGVTSTL